MKKQISNVKKLKADILDKLDTIDLYLTYEEFKDNKETRDALNQILIDATRMIAVLDGFAVDRLKENLKKAAQTLRF